VVIKNDYKINKSLYKVVLWYAAKPALRPSTWNASNLKRNLHLIMFGSVMTVNMV